LGARSSHTESYYKARHYRLKYTPDKKNPIVLDWKDSRKSLVQLLKWIRNNIPALHLQPEILSKELSKVSFGFRKGNVWNDQPLLDCLIGQLRTATKEGHAISYFKLNHKWFQISQELFSRIHEMFQSMLSKCLLHKGEEGFLERPWEPRTEALTLKKAAGELQCEQDTLRLLCKESTCYVQSDQVLHSKLEGEILRHPLISMYREKIKSF
jgi:hypothetical protein